MPRKKQKQVILTEREQEIARLIVKYGIERAGHSLFSPSSSAGWMNCKGFLLANAKKGDMAGYDAAYGTVGHAVAAEWLLSIREEGKEIAERVPAKHLDTIQNHNGFDITIDKQMIYHVRRYIEWCEEVELLGDVFIEQHVDYSEYTPIPNQGGTADHFVCIPPKYDKDGEVIEGGRMIITDLKLGMLFVDVNENTQALLYALGVYLMWNWVYAFEHITIRICQPRLDSFRTWDLHASYLLSFALKVKQAADAAWQEDAPRSPSQKACQWCADKACPARSRLLEDLADDAFDDEDVIKGTIAPEYTPEELDAHMKASKGALKERVPEVTREVETELMVWRLRQKAMFVKYFKEIEDELLRRALAGEDLVYFVPGHGRKSYEWNNPDEATDVLEECGLDHDEIYITEVTSVSKAREALRQHGFKPKEIQAMFAGSEDDETGLVKTNLGKVKLVAARPGASDVRNEADEVFLETVEDDF